MKAQVLTLLGGVIVAALGVGCVLDPGLPGEPPPTDSSATASPTLEPSPEPSPEPPVEPAAEPEPTLEPSPTPTETVPLEPTPEPTETVTPPPPVEPKPTPSPEPPDPGYPWHTNIVSTTFWVGEIFDPTAEDGSQMLSTYDGNWFNSYGGCDGIVTNGGCDTEPRTAENDYFPTSMTPKENPFYLDLPFDDINDPAAFERRGLVIPWAGQFEKYLTDPSISLMKNQWVEIRTGDRTCFGQIQDAGPGEYNDAEYVFGTDDARPANARYGGAGMDVSPALNGCLGFTELDGESDSVSWRFVDAAAVPEGPWTKLVTTSPVSW
jgi:hypothetical protein